MGNLPYFRVEGGAKEQRFEMPERETEVVVGRATDCQWIIPSGAVSRRHARLVRQGRQVTIEDLGSSNGTIVNGERLSAPRELRDQDRVQLGAVEIRFVIPPEEPSADETISVSALLSATAVKAPPIARPAETKATSEPHGGTGTTDVASPPRTPAAEELTPTPQAAAPPADAAAQPEPSVVSSSAPAAAPSGGRSLWSGALAADGSQPTIAELAIIAAGTFFVVFAIGALLIRFVF